MAAPTLTDYQQSNWGDTSTGSEVTASLTWSAGDMVVVLGITESQTATLATPTATGLTFTNLITVAIASTCRLYVWQARAASGGSSAITSTTDGALQMRGLSAWSYSGCMCVGATAPSAAAETAITKNLTREGANSAVIFGLGDFTANADVTVTASPSSGGTVRAAATVGGRATMFTASWSDQGAVATTAYGLASFAGVTTNTMVVVEIFGDYQIDYVGGQSGSFAGTTSAQDINFALTNGLATTPAAGDLVVATYFIGSTVDRALAIRNTAGTDYTVMGSELTQSDNFDANQLTAYRFMPGTPETQIRFTETVGGGTGDVADAGTYTIHVFRNVDTSTPMDVAVVTGGAINSSAVDPGAITPVTAGAVVYFAGGAASATGSVMTAGNNQVSEFRAVTQADTNDASLGAGFRLWTSGALNPAPFGGPPSGTTANSWTSITAALRPSSGGGGGRTTKNTRNSHHGIEVGMNWRGDL